MPKELTDTPATQYLMAMADKDGKPLWALTVYDRATMAFIYNDINRTTLSSYDLDRMRKNADDGVTIYVGPKPPLPAMRFYGGTEALNDKTFKMPDFELVE